MGWQRKVLGTDFDNEDFEDRFESLADAEKRAHERRNRKAEAANRIKCFWTDPRGIEFCAYYLGQGRLIAGNDALGRIASISKVLPVVETTRLINQSIYMRSLYIKQHGKPPQGKTKERGVQRTDLVWASDTVRNRKYPDGEASFGFKDYYAGGKVPFDQNNIFVPTKEELEEVNLMIGPWGLFEPAQADKKSVLLLCDNEDADET